MTPIQWKLSGQYFSSQKQKHHPTIFYHERGLSSNYQPVVIPTIYLHGFPTSSFDWHPLLDQLPVNDYAIAPDLLGYGFSDKRPKLNFSVTAQVDLLEEFLTAKNIYKFHLVAHDYGATVAQEFLARHNEAHKNHRPYFHILTVSLFNGGIFPDFHRPLFIQKLLLSPLGFLLSALLNRGSFSRNFSKIFAPQNRPSKTEINDFWYMLSYNKGRQIYHKLIRYIRERKKNNRRWVKALQEYTGKMQFINGSQDPISGSHMADAFARLVPHQSLIRLADIGHYPAWENPAVCAKYVRRLYKSV